MVDLNLVYDSKDDDDNEIEQAKKENVIEKMLVKNPNGEDVEIDVAVDVIENHEYIPDNPDAFTVFLNLKKYPNGIQMEPNECPDVDTFFNLFEKPVICKKAKGGFFLRSGNIKKYKRYYSNKGTYKQKLYEDVYPRCNNAMNDACLVIGDVDSGVGGVNAPSIDEVHRALKELNLNHVVYTTASHGQFINKLRFLVPCKLESEEHARITTNKLFDDLENVGCAIQRNPESGVWSQAWYGPTRESEDGLYESRRYTSGDNLESVELTHAQKLQNRVAEIRNNNRKSTKTSFAPNIPLSVHVWDKESFEGTGNVFDGSYEKHYHFLTGDKCSSAILDILNGSNIHGSVNTISRAFVGYNVPFNEAYNYLEILIKSSSAERRFDRLVDLHEQMMYYYSSYNKQKEVIKVKDSHDYIEMIPNVAYSHEADVLKEQMLDSDDVMDIPIYSLTDLAYTFLVNYKEGDNNYKGLFCNMLKSLKNPYALEVFSTVVGNDSYEFWNGYPQKKVSIGTFNYKSGIDVSGMPPIDDDKHVELNAVNGIDIRYKMEMFNKIFIKVQCGETPSFAKKINQSIVVGDDDFSHWKYKIIRHNNMAKLLDNRRIYTVSITSNGKKTVRDSELFPFCSKRITTEYSGLSFEPQSGYIATKNTMVPCKNSNNLNVYHGLNVVPKPGDWHIMHDHILNVLCDGKKDAYVFLMNYFAHMIQFPQHKPSIAIAFQGDEGAGKNIMIDQVLKMLGGAGVALSDTKSLSGGGFNGDLSGVICLVLNEAIWEGDRKGHSALKSAISEKTIMIERKGIDRVLEANHMHLIIITNHDAVAQMSFGDRRIVGFDVSDRMIGEVEYFKSLKKEINNGGHEALAFELLNRDLSGFDPYSIPKELRHSKSITASKLNTADPVYNWLYECLLDDKVYGMAEYLDDDLAGEFSVKFHAEFFDIPFSGMFKGARLPLPPIYQAYRKWCKSSGERRPMTNTMFTKKMHLASKNMELESKPMGVKHIEWVGTVRCLIDVRFEDLREAFTTMTGIRFEDE